MNIIRKLRAYRKLMRFHNEIVVPDIPGKTPLQLFLEKSKTYSNPRVLELGTLQSIKGRSTRHDDWVPHASEYFGMDVQAGADVDVVADVHAMSQVVGKEKFDMVISCSTFEHFKYPHLAAHEIMKVLKIGGSVFIQTHQTFHIHAYPYDYFRFSREALSSLFGTKMNFETVATNYDFRARILSKRLPNIFLSPAYLNSNLYGVKLGETPEHYQYELD